MFLGMRDFNFCPNLIKFYPIYPNFIHISPKLAQIYAEFYQILPKLA